MNKPSIILGALAIFALGFGAAYARYGHNSASDISIIRENSPDYRFINRILLIDNANLEFPEFDTLKQKIESQIRDNKNDGLADNVSVYFRDLNSSKWTGVGEKELYSPSSMLKIITLVAFLNAARNDPELLTEKVYFTDTPDPGQHYKPRRFLPDGNYSMRELLVHMVTESDNTAMKILNSRRPDKIEEVYKELQLPSPLSPQHDFMSAEHYSRVFRTLYSATYLPSSYSEEALKLLSFTTFNKGLVAGVPEGTMVSHKFGEHTLADQNGKVIERELHDCGIVYYPYKPYFLCVMTKGQDFEKLEKVISGMSSLVYSQIEKQ